MNKFPHTGEVTVQSLGFESVTVRVQMKASGSVYAEVGEISRYLGEAKEEKNRPEFYTPGMRFRRGADEFILIVSRFYQVLNPYKALLVNITTGGGCWEPVVVAARERITLAEFNKVTNGFVNEFELIEE
jgi:hypothetical protein